MLEMSVSLEHGMAWDWLHNAAIEDGGDRHRYGYNAGGWNTHLSVDARTFRDFHLERVWTSNRQNGFNVAPTPLRARHLLSSLTWRRLNIREADCTGAPWPERLSYVAQMVYDQAKSVDQVMPFDEQDEPRSWNFLKTLHAFDSVNVSLRLDHVSLDRFHDFSGSSWADGGDGWWTLPNVGMVNQNENGGGFFLQPPAHVIGNQDDYRTVACKWLVNDTFDKMLGLTALGVAQRGGTRIKDVIVFDLLSPAKDEEESFWDNKLYTEVAWSETALKAYRPPLPLFEPQWNAEKQTLSLGLSDDHAVVWTNQQGQMIYLVKPADTLTLDQLVENTPLARHGETQVVDVALDNVRSKSNVYVHSDRVALARKHRLIAVSCPLSADACVEEHYPREGYLTRELFNQRWIDLEVSLRDAISGRETQFWTGTNVLTLKFEKNRLDWD